MKRSAFILALAMTYAPLCHSQSVAPGPRRPLTLEDLRIPYDPADYRDPGDIAPLPDEDHLNHMFDGSLPLADEPDPVQPDPPPGLHQEVEISNGQLTGVSMYYIPWGLGVRVGVLGSDSSRSGLLSESPYLSITKEGGSSGKYFDTRYALQTGIIDMNARYFTNGPDADVDSLAAQLSLLYPDAADYSRNNDPYQSSTLFFNSMLYQIGRAYSLYGPIDVGWSASALVKATQIFPNASANATAGLRYRLSDDSSIGLFGGATQNFSPTGSQLIQGLIDKTRNTFGLNTETSPFASLKFRGPIPGEAKISLNLQGYRQWNQDTTLDKLTVGLGTDVGGRHTSLDGIWTSQRGKPGFEFDRNRRTLQLTREYGEDLSVSLGYFQEDITYGNANVANQGVMAGITWRFGGSGKSTGRVKGTYRSNPRDTMTSTSEPVFNAAITKLNNSISRGLTIIETAERLGELPTSPNAGDPDKNPERIDHIADALRDLTPEERAALEEALLSQADTEEERQNIRDFLNPENYDRLSDFIRDSAKGLRKGADILAILSRSDVLDRYIMAVARNQMAIALNQEELIVPELGMKFKVTPGLIIGAFQVLGNRPSPIAPISAADSKEILQPWIWESVARNLDMPRDSTPEEIVAKYLENAPPGIREELLAEGTDAAEALVSALSELMRKQLNEMMISMILAAEELNALTIGGNRQPGELGIDMMEGSFRHLDKRRMGRAYDRLTERLRGR